MDKMQLTYSLIVGKGVIKTAGSPAIKDSNVSLKLKVLSSIVFKLRRRKP
jgi:hypothetical protein